MLGRHELESRLLTGSLRLQVFNTLLLLPWAADHLLIIDRSFSAEVLELFSYDVDRVAPDTSSTYLPTYTLSRGGTGLTTQNRRIFKFKQKTIVTNINICQLPLNRHIWFIPNLAHKQQPASALSVISLVDCNNSINSVFKAHRQS